MTRTRAIPIIVATACCAGLLSSCRSRSHVPFPEGIARYQQPVAEPITMGPPEKLAWPTAGTPVSSRPVAFNYSSLPLAVFDSLGFQPFAEAPEQSVFDMAALPDAPFDLEQIPEIPLHFKTSVLPEPELISIARPQLKNNNGDKIFDFPEPVNGTKTEYVFRSKEGDTWFTSGTRLYRYDGENLFLYSVSDLAAVAYYITEDHEGRLWMLSPANGIVVLDLKQGVSKMLGKKQGLSSDFAVRAMVDHLDRVWVSFFKDGFKPRTSDGKGGFVLVIDPLKETGRIIREANGLRPGTPGGVMEDNQHNIWISQVHGGLNILDLENKRVRFMSKQQGLLNDTVTIAEQDSRGRIWVLNIYGSVNVLDPVKRTNTLIGERQGIKPLFSASMYEDQHGSHWFGNDKGVLVIDSSLGRIRKTGDLDAKGWGPVTRDARGQVLLTNASGLSMINKNGLSIHRAGSSQISTMLEGEDGRIWIGTLDRGIQILDTATGLVRIYDHAHGLTSDLVQYIFGYKGMILFSTSGPGIEIIDTALKTVQRLGAKENIASNLTTIVQSQDDKIWLAGLGQGISILDPDKKTISHLGTAQGLKDTNIIDLRKDQQGRMWFYSYSGVGVIDPVAKTVRHVVKSAYKALTGVVEDNLLLVDSRGNTWVMSSSEGLYMINPAGDSVTSVSVVNGLPTGKCRAFHEYEGRFYLGTELGVSIITPPWKDVDGKWSIRSLGKSNGLQKTVASYNSDMMLKDGQYWWGDDGITILNNLQQFVQDTVIPGTHFTALDLFGKRLHKEKGISWDSLTTADRVPQGLTLSYNKNYLQFHYAQKHLGSQDTVWYRYIVEGVDREWSNRTNKTVTENYPNMPPGHYTFRVSGFYHGTWSEPSDFSFTILPPWWFTWWAWLTYVIVGVAVLRAYIVFRSRRLLRENKMLEERIHVRTQQLQKSIEDLKLTQSQLVQSEKMASLGELTAGIAHEIQNPLNFINNFAEINKELLIEMKEEIAAGNTEAASAIADDVISNEEKINHHGRRADGIVKGMLQHSRSNQNAVKEPTDLNKLADEYLRLAYHGLRAKDKSFNATLKTDFDPALPVVNMMANDMGRVILNLITNAFYAVGEKLVQSKAGGIRYDPTVSVITRGVDSHVELDVSDNANGIPQRALDKIFQPFFTTKPAGSGTGLGLSLAYDIVKAHGGELKVRTKENEGTTFTIILPLK